MSLFKVLLYCMCGSVAAVCQTPITLVAANVQTNAINQTFGQVVVIPLSTRQKFPAAFYVRLFRGTKDSLKHGGTPVGACLEYSSTAITPMSSDGSIKLRGLADTGWLKARGDGFDDEDYVLVLEAGRASNHLFRIRAVDRDKYFESGIEMHVFAPEPLRHNVEERVHETVVAHNAQVVHLQTTEAATPCYGISRVERTVNTALILVPCSLSPQEAVPSSGQDQDTPVAWDREIGANGLWWDLF